MGADNQYGSADARGGAEVQTTVDGGGYLPLDEIATGYPADLSQVRRDDSRTCVLLVSGAVAAQGARRPFGAQGLETGMGQPDSGSGQPGGDASHDRRQGLRVSRPDTRGGGQSLSSLQRRSTPDAA